MASKRWTYFDDDEVRGLDSEFIAKLDLARYHAGIPFIITRGLSTAEENRAVGGVSDSAHLYGLAVDLKCHDSSTRYKIVSALLKVGLNRIGVYKDHVHGDVSIALPPGVLWIA